MQSDIITFEVVKVNGMQALAPKIYLSQNSIDKLLGANIAGNNANADSSSLAANSTIYAKENLTINAPNASLVNNGSIKAGNNINLNVASLTNKTISFANSDIGGISNVDNLSAATISAKNNLTITANNGDVKNIAANIFANNNLSIAANNGSILNTALVSTNDANLLSSNSQRINDSYTTNGLQSLTIANNASNLSGNIKSELLGISSIAGGSININAKNDFTNLASSITTTKNITNQNDIDNAIAHNNEVNKSGIGTLIEVPQATYSSGNLTITAGDDINIKTLELRNRSEATWGSRKRGGSSISDITTNITSNIESAGNITLLTTGNGNDTEGLKAQELHTQKQQKINEIQAKIDELESKKIEGGFYTRSYASQIKNLNSQIEDINTEYQNNLSEIALDIGSNINIIGSDIKAGSSEEQGDNNNSNGNITIASTNSVNILNAVDSNYSQTNSHKKSSVRTTDSVSINYNETATNSNLDANGNINITANNNILVQSSNLNAENNLTLESGNNTLIAQDHLNSFTFNQTSREYHGAAKIGVNITSSVIGVYDLVANLFYNMHAPILKEIDDPIQKLAKNLGAPSIITDEIDIGKIRDHKNDLKENSLYNISNKDSFGTNQTQISSSNLDANNNLTINANKDVVISASNLESNNSVNINAENLSILASAEMTQTTQENKTGRTLMFRNYNEMNANVSYVNSSLSAKDNDFNFNIQNSITTSFNSKNSEDLAYLNYLTQNKAEITTFAPQDNITLRTNDAVRGTTEAGTAVVAVAAVAATIATAGAAGVAIGAGATLAGTVGVAAASSLATTAAVSGTNASMNADGDLFKQLKDVGKITVKDTTSDDSLRNAAIAGATAGVTFGVTQGINELSSQISQANQAPQNLNTLNASGSLSNPSQLPTSLDSSLTNLSLKSSTIRDYAQFSSAAGNISFTQRAINALQNSAIQTVASSVAQSTVNGDSFEEALKNAGKTALINAVAQVAIGEVNEAVKYKEITPTTQLAAIAAIGCASGAASNGNCGASAAGAVVGAVIGDMSHDNKNISKETTSALAKVTSALVGAAIAGPDDGNAVFAASNIAATTQSVYHEFGLELTAAEKVKFDEAFASNDTKEVLRIIEEEKNIIIDDAAKEKIRQKVEGEVGGNKFIESLTPAERWELVQAKPIGVFFDGTGNDNKLGTIEKGHETNVYKLERLYNGKTIYETGVGTDGGIDKACLAFACGIEGKQQDAMNQFVDIYNKNPQPFTITDLIGFSRGAATAVDFGNKILDNGITSSTTNQSIPAGLVVVRSELLFDNVSSSGLPGNNIDPTLNLKIPKNVTVIHATAENENRNLFDLQSIKNKDGSLNNPNWIEKSFPGVHSDIGGSYATGDQGKENDIAKHTLNWMVNQANQAIAPLNQNQNIFNQPPQTQQPSTELTDLMNFYQEAKTENNQSNIDAAKTLLEQKYIHKETFSLSTPWNYDTGSERGVFYQDSH